MCCMNLKVRSKKYKKYFYCTALKKEVTCDECCNCELKEYKPVKPIKGKKHQQTKATAIQKSIKEIVWARDNHRCIFCNKLVDVFYANAHYIPRSAGGKGIEENIFTACEDCHRQQDNGLNTKEYDERAENYLRSIYGANWNTEKLIYRKRMLNLKKKID